MIRYAKNGDSKCRRLSTSRILVTAVATVICASFVPFLGSAPLAQAAAKSSSAVTNITWWNMWSGSTLVVTDKLVNQFNATHPNIHVTQVNVPASNGDAKLLSSIAAGDPPDVFTDWNAVLGDYANSGAILPMSSYLTGKYAGFEKFEYKAAVQAGLFNGKLYAVPMGLNSWALYYNKSMLKAAGITSPPTTLAQLNADQAKEWVIKDGRLSQYGFYPFSSQGVFMYQYLIFRGG